MQAKAALTAKSKYDTHETLLRGTGSNRYLAQAPLYATESHRVTNSADLEDAMRHVTFPAILKPLSGSGSAAVVKVHDPQECR